MTAAANEIARTFASARKSGRSLQDFPVAQPTSLAEAYDVQETQIRLSGAPEGWKVAAIKPELREQLGAARLAGPIMKLVDARTGASNEIDVTVVSGGFAAVEAEFVLRIRKDLPISKEFYSEAELLQAISSLHIGSEIAGSPLASLSDRGPTAVISDHGNNAAVVVGPEVTDWRDRSPETLSSKTVINGDMVGEGGASRLPTGGILGSLAFLVENLAQRGRFLRAGDWVATGATTGVHKVKPGDKARLSFGADGELALNIIAQQIID